MAKTKKVKTEPFNPIVHVDLTLIEMIAHEITNFWGSFKNPKMKRVLLLSKAGSDWFTVSVNGDEVYLGVPRPLIKLFPSLRSLKFFVLKDQPGIFISFVVGPESQKIPYDLCAIRIMTSKTKARMLWRCRNLTAFPINEEGEVKYFESRNTLGKFQIAKKTDLNWIS